MIDVCWWVHVSNAEVLQRSGLSTIGDILCHRRLSLFGHVACLDLGVSAHDALRLMVDTFEGRKASCRRPPGCLLNVWLKKIQEDTDALLLSIRCGDLRSPGVMERRNGPLGLRDDVMMMKDHTGHFVRRRIGSTNQQCRHAVVQAVHIHLRTCRQTWLRSHRIVLQDQYAYAPSA